MADMIYMATNDSVRTITYDLKIDDVAADLSAATVECHMTNRQTGVVITTAAVTIDADQGTYPGRIATEFSSTELATAGTYTLEWESTTGSQVVTFPGKGASRPILTIRDEAA